MYTMLVKICQLLSPLPYIWVTSLYDVAYDPKGICYIELLSSIYRLINWPKVYIPHCGGPLIE